MIKESFKKRLDDRLVNGEIDTDEYHRILQIISKNDKRDGISNEHHRTGSNKKLIWTSIFILLMYIVFVVYLDLKAKKEAEIMRMIDFQQAIQKEGPLMP